MMSELYSIDDDHHLFSVIQAPIRSVGIAGRFILNAFMASACRQGASEATHSGMLPAASRVSLGGRLRRACKRSFCHRNPNSVKVIQARGTGERSRNHPTGATPMQLKCPNLFEQSAYVGGSWIEATSQEHDSITNPANGEPVGHVPRLTAAQAARRSLTPRRRSTNGASGAAANARASCANGRNSSRCIATISRSSSVPNRASRSTRRVPRSRRPATISSGSRRSHGASTATTCRPRGAASASM